MEIRPRFGRRGRFALGALLATTSLVLPARADLASGQRDLSVEWPMLGRGSARTFYNGAETRITKETVRYLVPKWRFPTSEPVTASPAVVTVNVGGTPTRLVIDGGFDGVVWALRASSGIPLWRYQIVRGSPAPEALPGTLGVDGKTRQAAYGVIVDSPTVADVTLPGGGTERRVFVAGNATMVALDGATGALRWRFHAGVRNPRYHIESSPLVVAGKVIFGIDCNNFCNKGGVYALDAVDGRLVWFFDLESGTAFHPDRPIHEFDPSMYGPPGGEGCGSVWSSPAYDDVLRLLFLGSADCPRSPMPSFDEAVFALDLDGNPVWRWRPREIDRRDMDFGATPNVFVLGGRRVVGAAGKDGTYTLLDAPTGAVIWRTKLVGGGNFGGFYNGATDGKRIYLTSGIGEASDLFAVHEEALRGRSFALDARTGAVLWWSHLGSPTVGQNSATSDVYFTGGLDHFVHAQDTESGDLLWSGFAGGAVSSTPVVVDGELYVGAGTGATYFAAVGESDPLGVTGYEFPHPVPVSEFGQGVAAFCLSTEPSCATERAEVAVPGGDGADLPTHQTVLVAQGQQLDAFDVDSGEVRSGFVKSSDWVNGQTCFIPEDPQGRFVQADDNPAAGGLEHPFFGVFERDGDWTGLKIEGPPMKEPAGCAFDPVGNLIGVDVGDDHTPMAGDGLLVKFFAPEFSTWCVLDTGLSQPGMIAFDGYGRLYVPEAGAARVSRYTALPLDAANCSPPKRETFLDGFAEGIFTPSAIAPAPWGGWAVSSVLSPAGVFHVTERTTNGTARVDGVYVPPGPATGNPFGIGFDSHANLYYADLALGPTGDPFDPIGPVDGLGALKMVSPDGPPAPRTIAGGLSFPDGVTVVPASWIE